MSYPCAFQSAAHSLQSGTTRRVPVYKAELAGRHAQTKHTFGVGSRDDSYKGSGVSASMRWAKSLAYSRSITFQSMTPLFYKTMVRPLGSNSRSHRQRDVTAPAP